MHFFTSDRPLINVWTVISRQILLLLRHTWQEHLNARENAAQAATHGGRGLVCERSADRIPGEPLIIASPVSRQIGLTLTAVRVKWLHFYLPFSQYKIHDECRKSVRIFVEMRISRNNIAWMEKKSITKCWCGRKDVNNIYCKIRNFPLKEACCDHFFTTLTHLKLVEIFVSYERPYFSHQHTEIWRSNSM